MKRIFFYSLVVSTFALVLVALRWPAFWYAFIALGPILVLALYDMIQRRHTILRNYPVIGHVRYLLEDARHHIRQYLIQGDQEGDPFTRPQRSVVYQRAKLESDVQPFGTLLDVYQPGYEWFQHSVMPQPYIETERRVAIGGPGCSKTYEASRLNISAMSFGSLSTKALEALNGGAKRGGFYHNTGEGGLSEHHLSPGGDLVWQIGTGYFGCRTSDGAFDADQFSDKAGLPQVKMIELKLSQGAKPGGGGILPAAKVTPAIAKARGVPLGKDVLSPSRHSSFATPVEMMEFVAKLRELAGGKPVGLKLCIGRQAEFMAMLKAMRETEVLPDFITVDGSEGGTGAAPRELTDRIGMPLREGLLFAHDALRGTGLRDDIRLIASGKIINAFDMAAKIALGADVCNSARGMMFALGCIQARRCHANTCPTGIATQDRWRVQGLDVADKTERVANYHHETLRHFHKLLAACGLSGAEQLDRSALLRRVSPTEVTNYAVLHPPVMPGVLLDGGGPAALRAAWAAADARRF